jgi:hypothetical protein
LLPVLFGACRAQPQPVSTASSPTPQAAVSTSTSPTSETKPFPNPPGIPPPIMNHPYQGTGIVKIVNQKEGWVSIKHEEIKDYMPAMEMEFWVSSRSLLDNINVGDQIDFVVVENEKGQYVTEIKKK